jgi:fructose-bisphosphate aldolase class II
MSDKVHYSDLGLVNTRDMFAKAMAGGYAIPAYNFNNLEQLQAIVTACVESRSPVIIQVSKGAREYANATMLRYMAMGAVKMANEMGVELPVCLHLDHGDSFEVCKSCVDNGFSSVMIDGSHLPFDENVALTKKVVEYAHQFDVTVEGEVEDFVKKTGVDSLAISIGTSHGAFKFKLKEGEEAPPLRFDILEEIEKRIPGFPIVLHGASSVVPDYVTLINQYGGKMEGAVGVSEEQLRRAAKSAVCKINIDSDGRLVVTAKVREYLANNPGEFDPRKYLGAARKELIKLLNHKNEAVLGSAGKA